MAQARGGRSSAGAPSGWVLLLGLMVLALLIAAVSKGCGSDEPGPAAQSPTTSTASTSVTAGVAVIAQINAEVQRTGIVFVTGKTDLTAESKSTLDAVAAILTRNPDVKAEVQGHTDSEGDAGKNLELSQARAQAVVDYLVTKGIPAARLTARGLGEAVPLVPNTTEEGRAKNRRVEFQLAP